MVKGAENPCHVLATALRLAKDKILIDGVAGGHFEQVNFHNLRERGTVDTGGVMT
jgi:hypothetical protein